MLSLTFKYPLAKITIALVILSFYSLAIESFYCFSILLNKFTLSLYLMINRFILCTTFVKLTYSAVYKSLGMLSI